MVLTPSDEAAAEVVLHEHNEMVEYMNDRKVPRSLMIATIVFMLDSLSAQYVDDYVAATEIVTKAKEYIAEGGNDGDE